MIAVVGLGSIGLRHLRNLVEIGADVVGVEPDEERAMRASSLAPVAVSLDALAIAAGIPDAVVVATPATSHAELALSSLRAGADVFVEKPLCVSVAASHELRAALGDRVMAVGFNLRFDPMLRALRHRTFCGFTPNWASVKFGHRLSEWRPGDYRGSVSAKESLGGGILREASHELDLVRWLFGEWVSVTAVVRRLSSLEIDVEDTVAALIETVDGTLVELHLDMTRPTYTRRIETLDKHGHSGEWELDRRQIDQTYRDEMRDFLTACQLRRQPEASLEDGIAAMELDAAIRLSYATRKTVERPEVEGDPSALRRAA